MQTTKSLVNWFETEASDESDNTKEEEIGLFLALKKWSRPSLFWIVRMQVSTNDTDNDCNTDTDTYSDDA